MRLRAAERFDLLRALLFGRAAAVSAGAAGLSRLLYFGFFGNSLRTGGKILRWRERRHKDCVAAFFIFALWNIC